ARRGVARGQGQRALGPAAVRTGRRGQRAQPEDRRVLPRLPASVRRPGAGRGDAAVPRARPGLRGRGGAQRRRLRAGRRHGGRLVARQRARAPVVVALLGRRLPGPGRDRGAERPAVLELMRVFAESSLPVSNIARELVGVEFDVGVCTIFVDAPPGRGPSLHRHPYEEIIIVTEGEATFFGASVSAERVVRGGEVVIVPANEPHGFKNTGDGPLKQIDIHVSPVFETEWL